MTIIEVATEKVPSMKHLAKQKLSRLEKLKVVMQNEEYLDVFDNMPLDAVLPQITGTKQKIEVEEEKEKILSLLAKQSLERLIKLEGATKSTLHMAIFDSLQLD
ncbi:hypothetical protein [Bernardetia sp.]|uniref:hypothetical protein n=1 Tax=Bernardetia sp. TaxID=1937974 RepID=UPI0025C5EDB9|nr:hypothetical protein [Bernardetia sp.]